MQGFMVSTEGDFSPTPPSSPQHNDTKTVSLTIALFNTTFIEQKGQATEEH